MIIANLKVDERWLAESVDRFDGLLMLGLNYNSVLVQRKRTFKKDVEFSKNSLLLSQRVAYPEQYY